MKNFIKGFRFTPSNYPAEVEAKIQKYRKQGYKLPPRKVLRTPEQLEGIRESAKINTALLDYISENIREGMSTEEIDVLVYDFTTSHGAIPAPLNYEGFPKSVCTSINDVVCHGIPNKNEILKSGDIINVDVSTILDGYFSDASRMFMIGKVSPEMQRLVQVARECLEAGLQAARPWGFLGDIGAAVLRDRRDLSGDGVVLAVATVDFKSKMILAGPDILSRGFIYMRESGDLIRDSQRILFNAIRIALKNKDASIQSVNGAIVNALRPFLYEKTEREPIIIPMILTPDN